MRKPRRIDRGGGFTPVDRVKRVLYKKPDKKEQKSSDGFAKLLEETLQKVDEEPKVLKHKVLKSNELLIKTIITPSIFEE